MILSPRGKNISPTSACIRVIPPSSSWIAASGVIDRVGLGLPDGPWDVASTPDGKYLGLSFYATAAVRASTRNPENFTLFDNLYGARDIGVSPNGRFFYVTQGYSQLSSNISAVTRINNADDTATAIPLPGFPFPTTIDLNYNGTSMLVGCSTILAHVLNPSSDTPEVQKVSTPIYLV